jgi:hypothetical protein
MVGGKGCRGTDIFHREVRVVHQDLLIRHAFGHFAQDKLDRDACPLYHQLAKHDLGINGYAIVNHTPNLQVERKGRFDSLAYGSVPPWHRQQEEEAFAPGAAAKRPSGLSLFA